MRRNIEQQIQDRRLELELEEFSGRAAAPDRLHEILARSTGEPSPAALHTWAAPAPSQTANTVAAVLVSLAIGVTATLYSWNMAEQPLESRAIVAVPAQGKQPPEPQGKAKTKRGTGKRDTGKPKAARAQDPATSSRPKAATADPDPLTGLLRTKLGKQAEANKQPRANPLGRLLAADPAKANVERSVRRIQAALQRARLDGRVVQPGPMQQGEVGKVMVRLQRDVQELTQSGSPELARKRLDELQRTVDDARRAIWEMRKRAKQPAAKGDK